MTNKEAAQKIREYIKYYIEVPIHIDDGYTVRVEGDSCFKAPKQGIRITVHNKSYVISQFVYSDGSLSDRCIRSHGVGCDGTVAAFARLRPDNGVTNKCNMLSCGPLSVPWSEGIVERLDKIINQSDTVWADVIYRNGRLFIALSIDRDCTYHHVHSAGTTISRDGMSYKVLGYSNSKNATILYDHAVLDRSFYRYCQLGTIDVSGGKQSMKR